VTSALEGGGWSAPCPTRFTSRKDLVPIVEKAGWAPRPVWMCAKKLAPTGIRSPDVQPVASHYTDLAISAHFLSHSRKVKHWFRECQWDYCRFWLQNLFVWQVMHQLTPQIKRVWLKLRVMIFCRAQSQMIRVGCMVTTQKWKASRLDYNHPISLTKKKFKTQPSAGKCMLTIFWKQSDITCHE
jgi:hypothetical protein